MGLFARFRHDPDKKKGAPASYDRERLEPVIRCSICTGEQTAGFLEKKTGKFQDVCLIRTPEDLDDFKDRYGITGDIGKIY